MYEYSKEAQHKKMEVKDAVRNQALSMDYGYQQATNKLKQVQYALEREQQKLDNAPRIRNGKHNQEYGKQLNIRDAWKEEVEKVEREVAKAENDFSRKRYLARLDAERKAQEDARKAEQVEYAKKQEASAKAEFGAKYIASGGTPEQLEKAWPDVWAQKLVERASTTQPSGALAERRESGLYNL
jgi:hypothetical protein